MNHALAWRDGRVVAADFPMADLDGLLADPANLVWFDLVDPDPAQLNLLAGELSLGAHAIEDAVAPAERPKAHRNGRHLFVQAYAARLAEGAPGSASRLETSRISAFVLPRALITVRTGEVFDHATH